MKFSKTKRKKIKIFAKAYLQAYKRRLVDNPDFEYCIKSNNPDWKCNTCEYKDSCGLGEQIWEENTNVIPELIDKLLDEIEKM